MFAEPGGKLGEPPEFTEMDAQPEETKLVERQPSRWLAGLRP
jgi:hypothetical protein